MKAETAVLRGTGLSIIAAVAYAFSLVMARISYDHGSDPATVMAVRFGALAVLLWGWRRWRAPTAAPMAGGDRGWVALCGVLYFIGIFAYLSSIAHLPVSLAVLLFYTFPLLVMLFEAVAARRAPPALGGLALLLALGGLALALGGIDADSVSRVGLTFSALAATGVAVNLLVSARVVRRVGALPFLAGSAWVNAALASAVLIAGAGLQLPQSGTGALAFGLMLLAFFAGYCATFNAIRLIAPARFASVMNLEPVATLVFAAVLLGEQLVDTQWLGAAVVIGAVVLAQWAGGRGRPAVAD